METLQRAFQPLPLTEEAVSTICAKFSRRAYAKNDYLLRAGQVATHLFFLDKGSLILGNDLPDKQLARHLAREGEFITSLESFPSQIVTSEFLKATEPVEVYALGHADFEQLLMAYPPLSAFYQQFILDTLLKCQQRIRDLISLDAKAYYQQLQHQQPAYLRRMPQYELASYLGIKPQSLSRLRKDYS